MNLTEFRKLVTPKVIAANWTEAASNKIPYLGETLFPSKQKEMASKLDDLNKGA